MSFGKSPDEYRELAGAAHATLLNARKACGDGDALTLNISSLHHVLARLSTDVEGSEKEGGLRKRESDNRWRELATLARDCAHLLKVLNQVLGKYNSLPDEKKKVTKLWRRVKFGNGETLDLDKIQGEMGTYTQAISLFLGLVERGVPGKVEGYMDAHGAELREVKHTLHWVVAKMLALRDEKGNKMLRSVRTGKGEGDLWHTIRKELMGEGWASNVLSRHQKIIVKYILELGEKGVLDAALGEGSEPVSNGDYPLSHDVSTSSINDAITLEGGSLAEDDSESDETESSLDEEGGTEMPLGRRRSSTVSAEKRPDLHTTDPSSRDRSLDGVESSEDESEDEPSSDSQHTTAASINLTQPITPPTPVNFSDVPATMQETGKLSHITNIEMNAQNLDISNSASMALSISNLPPLPISRPRSRNSEISGTEGGGQPLSGRAHAAQLHSPPAHSTTGSLVHSGRTSVELLSPQTLSISSLPPLPISRPRSRNSNHAADDPATEFHSDQTNDMRQSSNSHPLRTSSERAANVGRVSKTFSDESSTDEDKVRPERTPARTVEIGFLNGSTDLLQKDVDKVDLTNLRKFLDQDLSHTLALTAEPPASELNEIIPIPSPEVSGLLPKSHTYGITTKTKSSNSKLDVLSKSETMVRPSLNIPVVFKQPSHGKMVSSPVKKEYAATGMDGKGDQMTEPRSPLVTNQTKSPNSAVNVQIIGTNARESLDPATNHQQDVTVLTPSMAKHSNQSARRAPGNRQEVEPKAHRFLRPQNESGLRAINSESSIARPQIPRTTDLSFSQVVAHKNRKSVSPKPDQISVVDSNHPTSKTNNPSQSQASARGQFSTIFTPPVSAFSAAIVHHEFDLVETERSEELERNEGSSGDESELSYLIIKGGTGSQMSDDEEPESIQADISQTESLEHITSESIIAPGEVTDARRRDIDGDPAHASEVGGDGADGKGYMNAWSVILSRVGDDPESTLLETSGVWAQSNSTTGTASAQQVTKDLGHLEEPDDARQKIPKSAHAGKKQEDTQTRSRNVTLVGDSDDEPRPPNVNDLWPEGAQLIYPSKPPSNEKSRDPKADTVRDYRSGTDESVTVPGDSDNEPMSPLKGAALLAPVKLPVISHKSKGTVDAQEVESESEFESSDEEIPQTDASPKRSGTKHHGYDTEHSRTLPILQFRIKADEPKRPVTFREMDYQPEKRTPKNKDNSISDLGPLGEAKGASSRRSRSKSTVSTASISDASWNKEIETRMEEYQVAAKTAKATVAHTDASLASGTSSTPVFRKIASFGSSNRSWWWSSNKAARAKYQPTIEDVNDEDLLPGAHPNCWSNESERFSQVGSDTKSVSDLSSSVQKDPKPHLAHYLNPFKEMSTPKGYRIDPTAPRHASDDEASSFGFPSSDENEEIRKYRSGRQIIYEDPDLSFNSDLEDSSDADDELRRGKQVERVEATSEQKEAFRKGIKADQYRKKRYRLEKGKEAVWGSASEREERRKVRFMRKKGIENPKITGGKKTVTFEIDEHHEARLSAHRAERHNANKEACRAFIEEIRDEDFVPGAHPNCETGLGQGDSVDVTSHQDAESSIPTLNPILKVRTANTSVSPSKSGANSRQSKPKRLRHTFQMPQSDDDKDEDLRRYRREVAAQIPQEDTAPSWRSTRAYRNKKSKQRRFSHGEDEKFWDEPSSWGGEAGSSEDDWGETYRSDNSRNSSVVAIGGCTCCVAEAPTKRRRQHYRSPPVIHHPELNPKPVNPFLPAENNAPATATQTHARRRSSIDPWSPDPPIVRRHRREKTSESPTYHVPDAPAPVLNSTRPELPTRRRTENPEGSTQAVRPDLGRRRTDNVENPQQAARPEAPRRTIRTAVREHSPTKIKTEAPRRRIESTEDPLPLSRPDIGRRTSERKQSPTRPDMLRRRTDTLESIPQATRPDIRRRGTVDRDRSRSPVTARIEASTVATRPEIKKRGTIGGDRDRSRSPVASRPEMPRRGMVDREWEREREHNKPREKLLRFDIK